MDISILIELFGTPKEINNNSIKFNCPICKKINFGIPDNKYNLEINIGIEYEGKIARPVHCWKCNTSDNLNSFVKKHSNKQQYKKFLLEFKNQSLVLTKKDKPKIYSLPKEFISFKDMDYNNPDHLKAYNYIVNERKVSKTLLIKNNIGFALSGKYKNRIIFPSYDLNNKINFYISRTFLPNVEPKYLIPYADKNSIIFNERDINWNSTVYLVEAYLEYTTIPLNSIILLGKVLPDIILDKLIKYKPNIIILLNPDAHDKRDSYNYKMKPQSILEIKEKLESYSLDYILIPQYKDNNDLNKNMQNLGKRGIFNLLKEILI
jgi:hypothetical protein